ncbi:hypothetical protein L3Q82_017197 [Scortum barcoo]|uniref:Uncharacterized protein n=1 Tax=Scortum barcoo TaxID=214431 RepID=A0ACB8VM15_9TELE|nr:hypothetical protein L3Q82_017197 [Scortum barcoo]
MEFCDGGDLMKRINMQRGVAFTEEQIVDWFCSDLSGPQTHPRQENPPQRHIKAQVSDTLTHTHTHFIHCTMELARTRVGTPYYLSPEICESRPYNNKTYVTRRELEARARKSLDIWSLGCVLYELCTLRHPCLCLLCVLCVCVVCVCVFVCVCLLCVCFLCFEGSSLRQLVSKICRGRYNPVPSRYSYDLRLLVTQLFKVNPRNRPSVSSLLRRHFLEKHISKHLDPQVMKEEFSHTVLHRNRAATSEAVKTTADDKSDTRSDISDVIRRAELCVWCVYCVLCVVCMCVVCCVLCCVAVVCVVCVYVCVLCVCVVCVVYDVFVNIWLCVSVCMMYLCVCCVCTSCVLIGRCVGVTCRHRWCFEKTLKNRPPDKPAWRVPLRACSPAHCRQPLRQRAADREAAGQNDRRFNEQQPVAHYQHYHTQLDACRRKNKEDVPPPHLPPPHLPPPHPQDRERERCEEAVEPYQLVAAARNEYLQRRQEANQYKLRAEKQLDKPSALDQRRRRHIKTVCSQLPLDGLRPCTAEGNRKARGQEQEVRRPEHQHTPQDRKQEGRQEYLRQLDVIRQQYHQEMRQMRLRAEAEAQPQHKHETFVVEKLREPEASAASREQQRASPAQDVEAALRRIREETRDQRRALQRKHRDKKGIMFEIRLDDDEGRKEDEEKEKEEGQEEEAEEGDGGQKEEVDLLNRTLSFQEGEELKLRDWSEVRRGWSQRTPQTLLDVLANMDVNSVCNTAVEAEQGEEAAGRRRWVDDPPNTLLNALAEAELKPSTVETETADLEAGGAAEEEEEDSDVEEDEERLESRSDDDDTNFEESEDELREAVADSMKNLFVMEDSSSDEEDTEEDGTEEKGGGAEQLEVKCSPVDVAAAPTVSVSCEAEEGDECSDDNTTQRQTS